MTPEQCKMFLKNPGVNPVSKRRITQGGPTWVKLMEECKNLNSSSGGIVAPLSNQEVHALVKGKSSLMALVKSHNYEDVKAFKSSFGNQVKILTPDLASHMLGKTVWAIMGSGYVVKPIVLSRMQRVGAGDYELTYESSYSLQTMISNGHKRPFDASDGDFVFVFVKTQ